MSTINVPDDERTIQGAVNRAHDGDTVVVHGESEAEPTVYDERVWFTDAPAANLAVMAEPRRSVSVLGINTPGAGDGLTIEGLCVKALSNVHAVYIASPNVTIRDFAILNAPWAAIYVSPDNPDLPGGTIENCHAYGCGTGFHTTGVGWKVLNNDIERLIRRGNRDADYLRGWGEDLLIRGNHLHGTTQDEIGSAHVDGFQTFDNNGRRLHGLRFLENIVEDTHQGMILEAGNEAGAIRDILVWNNWFLNCWNVGVYAKDGVKGVQVLHNLFQNMGNRGVFQRRSAEVAVFDNIFQDAGGNYHGDGTPGLDGGHNILNRQGHPYHSDPTDLLDVDPVILMDGYPGAGSPAIGAGLEGTDIGRIRTGTPDPDPEEPPEGHDHDGVYASMSHVHQIPPLKPHAHPIPPHTHVAGGVRPTEPTA